MVDPTIAFNDDKTFPKQIGKYLSFIGLNNEIKCDTTFGDEIADEILQKSSRID